MNGYESAFAEEYGEQESDYLGEATEEEESVRRLPIRPRLAVARAPYARARPPVTVSGADFQRALDAVRQDVQKLGSAVTAAQRQTTQVGVQARRDIAQLRETGQNAAFITAAVALLLQPKTVVGRDVLPVVIPPLVPAVMSLMTESRGAPRGSQSVFRGNIIPVALLGLVVWQRLQDGGSPPPPPQ